MISHVILGLLTDNPAHGYEIGRAYELRCAQRISLGSVYRELARLKAAGLVEQVANSAGVDPRRISYRATGAGRRAFDRWLCGPASIGKGFPLQLLFVERLPDAARIQLMDAWQRALEGRRDHLTALRERSRPRRDAPWSQTARLLLVNRELLRLSADLDLLQKIRSHLGAQLEPVAQSRAANGNGRAAFTEVRATAS